MRKTLVISVQDLGKLLPLDCRKTLFFNQLMDLLNILYYQANTAFFSNIVRNRFHHILRWRKLEKQNVLSLKNVNNLGAITYSFILIM